MRFYYHVLKKLGNKAVRFIVPYRVRDAEIEILPSSTARANGRKNSSNEPYWGLLQGPTVSIVARWFQKPSTASIAST